jgi:hypothetical protein
MKNVSRIFQISEWNVYTVNYIPKTPVENQIATQWNQVGSSMTASPPVVIAHQYSSASLFSLFLHSSKVKFGAPLKNVVTSIFFTFM